MAGFSPATRNLIIERSDGMCERCAMRPGVEHHHRRARGAGGSRDPITNTAANALNLCSQCHRDCESHRTVALEYGWLVRQGHDPRTVAVFYQGRWAILTQMGTVEFETVQDRGMRPEA